MNPIQVVIDTNVMVSGLRSDRGASFQLIRKLGSQNWEMNLSTALVLEYEAALKRDFARRGKSLDLVDDFLDYVVTVANRRRIFFRWRPGLPDPGDNFVLELAVASCARYVVTFNTKDFEGVEAHGINAIRPIVFLRILENLP